MMMSYRCFRGADCFHAEDVGTSRTSSDSSVSTHPSTWLNIPKYLNFNLQICCHRKINSQIPSSLFGTESPLLVREDIDRTTFQYFIYSRLTQQFTLK